jgi:hypothetical protein
MTISEAQKLSITGYLSSMGIKPETYRGNDVWYCSPFRPGESKPSFKVDTDLNKWVDFGRSETMGPKNKKGGDLIDLIRAMYDVTIPGALLMLASPEIASKQSVFFRGEVSDNRTDENRIVIQHIQPLQNRALIQYIESRGISCGLAARYCKEAYYTITNLKTGQPGKYFSLAFPNDRGGWALRNRYFKNAASPTGITTITGTLQSMLSIFEGFVDFLSACQYFKVPKPAGTVIILNSTVNIKQTFPLLSGYDKVNLYLDCDATGREATRQITERHPKVTDYSQIIYPDFKDFNEFLCNNLKIKTA